MWAAGVPRGEVFLTSKLGPAEMGFAAALRAAAATLARLGTDYVDLYLVHWPGCARTPLDSRRHRETRSKAPCKAPCKAPRTALVPRPPSE